MELALHPVSRRMLDTAFNALPHAVLISGAAGVGLATIAQHYARGAKKPVLTLLPEKDEKVDLEKGVISIERIRQLYDSTKTIAPDGRIVIIDYAERMGVPAQNAFLKLLEEPVSGTHFILLSHSADTLLPTIRSRTQAINLRPITNEQTNELLTSLKVADATKRAQLTFIAQGLPAELTRLVADEAQFADRASIVKDAREYITGTPYQRLLIAKKYKDSRARALLLIEDAMKQLGRTIASGQHNSALVPLSSLEKLHKRLTEQGNVRLQLSSVVLL